MLPPPCFSVGIVLAFRLCVEAKTSHFVLINLKNILGDSHIPLLPTNMYSVV